MEMNCLEKNQISQDSVYPNITSEIIIMMMSIICTGTSRTGECFCWGWVTGGSQ